MSGKTMNFGRLFFLAPFVIVGALIVGCNGLNDPLEPQPKDSQSARQSICVGFSDSTPATKAISAAGVKAFVPGDKIAVLYIQTGSGDFVKVVSEALEADDIREEGRRADFTVAVVDPEPESDVYYFYPADMVDSEAQVNYSALDTQDGTLATIGRDLDLSIFHGEITPEGKLPASATLGNSFALLEISILNADASYDITKYTSSLTVSDGTNTYNVTPPAPATTFGDGPVYVLIAECEPDETLTFTTSGGASKSVSGHKIKKGHMYPIGLRLGDVVNLGEVSETDGDGFLHYVAHHGDVLQGNLSSGHISIADGASVTLDNVNIKRDDYFHQPHLGCLGDGTILLAKDSESILYTGPECCASGIFVPKGKTVTIGGEGALKVDCETCYGAAIGGGFDYNASDGTDCGTIIIEGGVLNLRGGFDCPGIGAAAYSSCDGIIIRGGIIKNSKGGFEASGIGTGYSGVCGDILISGGMIGGEIESDFYYGAQGGKYAAGIGCGVAGTCGDITIGPDITFLIAMKGENATKHIGRGGLSSTCGTVTVAPELYDTGEEGFPNYRLIRPATPEDDD